MAQQSEIEKFLEDEFKKVANPLPETFKVVYRRRGSDLIFGATEDQKVQITRFNHRFKRGEHYVHDPLDIESKREEIKKLLVDGGYKLHERINSLAQN